MASITTASTSNRVGYAALLLAAAALLLNFVPREPASTSPLNAPAHSTFPQTGRLKVAVVPAPPITAFDPISKAANGYAIDVMNAVARNAKIELEYLPGDWATMGAALASGKADIVVGPIFMTEGRAREFSFTAPLFAYAIVPVVEKKTQILEQLADLKKPGLRVAVGRGGFDSEFVSRNMPEAKVSVFPPDDPNLSMLEVLAGRADVALVDFATAQKFVAEHQEVEIRLEGTPAAMQYAGFMLRQQDVVLRDFLNIALRNLDLSGELSTIDATYAEEKAWYGRVSLKPAIVR